METVFSGLSALVIDDVADDGEVIRVLARTRDAPFPCPMCGVPTGKVHGYHVRTVADVPVDGRRVVVNIRVRRVVCPVLGCRRQTFREQAPGLIERLQRRATRLTSQVSGVVKELCGRAAARLTRIFGGFFGGGGVFGGYDGGVGPASSGCTTGSPRVCGAAGCARVQHRDDAAGGGRFGRDGPCVEGS